MVQEMVNSKRILYRLPIETERVPEHTLSRIPHYHQILLDMELSGSQFVSSGYLSGFFGIDSTQVRKDLALIGYRGKPKTGYSVAGLKQAIAAFLGITIENEAVLIGAGKLGSALIEYPGFHEYGLNIVGVFDNNPDKIGTIISDHSILSMESLPRVVRSYRIQLAILSHYIKRKQMEVTETRNGRKGSPYS